MNLLVRLIPTIGFAVLFSTVCFAGNKQDEGESLIRRVEQISDIRFVDARPFRLKANFTLLGDGIATGEGTYTEVWVSHGRWRRETALAAFHRIEVGGEKTLWTLDSAEGNPGKAGQLGALMQISTRHQESIKVASIHDQTIGGVAARCVVLKGVSNETLCIDPQRGVLLLKETATLWMGKILKYSCQYSQYEEFAGRMYPRHIRCVEDGHPGSEGIEVRVLELLSEPSPDSALFVPPVGAKEQASCSGKLQAPRALYTPQPDYPINEPLPGSPVVIWLIVGVDGKPHDLKIIRSLGKTFDDRALAAVGRWTFKPSMCDGDPVPVQINVEMAF